MTTKSELAVGTNQNERVGFHSDDPELAVSAELAVVIPTYEERENIFPLVEALATALSGLAWEIVFVDDNSADGTLERIRELASVDCRVRLVRRVGRRGLSSACIEGMLSTSAPYIAVMDADLQHDESILPEMLGRLKSESMDVVVGSRMISGGSMGDFSRNRILLSTLGAHFSRMVCDCEILDPMSGFFILNRNFFERTATRLHATGFKLLIDILSSSPCPVRIVEVPYQFRNRQRGESKLSLRIELEYVQFLMARLFRGKLLRRNDLVA